MITPKKFFKEKFRFLKSLANEDNRNDYFVDEEFKPEKGNLIGQGRTDILSNDEKGKVVSDLADKELKRLKKLRTYKFERINTIISSPLVPVIFRTKGPRNLGHFASIPSKDKLSISPIEAHQGTLSNCYLISSLSALANYPDLLTRVFLKVDPACGIYSLALCVDGFFEEIIIDDYLPCSASKTLLPKKVLKIRMCHPYNYDKDEFQAKDNIPVWASLIEKAYSKVFKGFWNIGGGGGSVRAFKDLTGAPVSFHFFDDMKKEKAWQLLKDSKEKGYPMSAPTHQNSDKMNFMGLILNNWHSYSVLDVLEFETSDQKRSRFIKVRDPWGNVKWPEPEGNSERVNKWVDRFKEWTKKAPEMETELTGNPAQFDDGTLYITLDDFLLNFSEVSICHYIKENILSQKKIFFKTKEQLKDDEDEGFMDFVSTYQNSISNYVFSRRSKVMQISFKSPGNYYIMMSQRDKRHEEIEDHHYLVLNLLRPELFGETDFKEILSKSESSYIGGFSSNIRDPYMIANIKEPGCYLLYLKVPDSYAETSHSGTVSTYGPEACLISEVKSSPMSRFDSLINQRKKKFENIQKIALLNKWLFRALKRRELSRHGFEEIEIDSEGGGIAFKPKSNFKKKGWHAFEGQFNEIFYCLTGAKGGYGAAIFYNDIKDSSSKKSNVKIRLWLRGTNIAISKPDNLPSLTLP